MKLRQTGWVIGALIGCLFLWTGITFAQTSSDVQLQIRVRHSDGTAVTGETLILQRLPEEEPITPALWQAQGDKCETNADGACTWYVGRGLYQVLFTRPLDDVSALAVAEGGLRGFGITVGDEDIVYHFTFHSDGRVYFDAAPEAAVPSPIIPVGDILHGGISPTSTPSPKSTERIDVTTRPSSDPIAPEGAANPTSGNSWRVFLFIGGGLVIGGGLHFLRLRPEPAPSLSKRQVWPRKKQMPDQPTNRLNEEETKDA